MVLRAKRQEVEEARERAWAAFDELDDDIRYGNTLAFTYFTDFSKISSRHFDKKITNWEAVRAYRRVERDVRRQWLDPTFDRQVGEVVFWRGEDGGVLDGTLRGITRDGDKAYAAVEAVDGSFHAGPLNRFLTLAL